MRLGGGQLVSEELMNLGESFIQTNDLNASSSSAPVHHGHPGPAGAAHERGAQPPGGGVEGSDGGLVPVQALPLQHPAQGKLLQLHCKTDKHVQKYQLVAHIKEGGKANEWRPGRVAIGATQCTSSATPVTTTPTA